LSLKHAILGFLNMRPFSGYELYKLFNGSVNNYWSATHTQIYKALSELARVKMVEIELVHQETNPDKKVYHLKQSGKAELQNWLETPLDLAPVRDKFLVQFSFSDSLDDKDIICNIESYIEKINEKMDVIKAGHYSEYLKYAHSNREKFLWEKTLEHGIRSYENELHWLRDCLSELKQLSAGTEES
jgi:PadR family transcriptional regulator, regulatory protein AphA